jgi:predicted DNA-binding transcriptional regulator AlpA
MPHGIPFTSPDVKRWSNDAPRARSTASLNHDRMFCAGIAQVPRRFRTCESCTVASRPPSRDLHLRLSRPFQSMEDAQPFTNRSHFQFVRPRREAMTSRSSMLAPRQHPRHRKAARRPERSTCCTREISTMTIFERYRSGGRIMKPQLTVGNTAGSSRTATALTETQVAEQLGLSVATLRAWRHRGRGPRFLRFGRAVRYLPADLDAFIRASAVDTRSVSASDGESKAGELRV